MNFEKKLDKVSISEILIISLAFFLILNGLAYLVFTLIFSLPFGELFSKTWIIFILFPLMEGIILPYGNRNGLLKIDGTDKSENILTKIKELLYQKEYQVIETKNGILSFEYKTAWKWIVNLNKGRVNVYLHKSFVEISGKQSILRHLETKLKGTM